MFVQMYFFLTTCQCGIFDAPLVHALVHASSLLCVNIPKFPPTLVHFFSRLCQQNEFEEQATRRVDDLLESYMGIRDLELGKTTHMTLMFLK